MSPQSSHNLLSVNPENLNDNKTIQNSLMFDNQTHNKILLKENSVL